MRHTMTIRMNGTSERFGKTEQSPEFRLWEIRGETDVDNKTKKHLVRSLGRHSVALDAGKYCRLPKKGLTSTFIEQPDFGYGREDSRHGVRFGQLILNGPGVHEIPDLVAIKPFEERGGLYNEWASNAYVNGLFDEQRAYLPLGILKDEHGVPAMISLYEHGIKTADNVFWADRELSPEALRADVIKRTATTCMYGLGLMHGARLVHGDAQAKNLGSDARHVRFIDLEDSLLIPADGVDSAVYTDKIIKDIATFIGSTGQVDENREQITEALYKPTVIDTLIKSYRQGIDKARSRQPGIHVPDYATTHEDAIRALIDRQYK